MVNRRLVIANCEDVESESGSLGCDRDVVESLNRIGLRYSVTSELRDVVCGLSDQCIHPYNCNRMDIG